ncbi:hypothetical protein GCM10009677_26760 [Sphaerisporangium rubeum]|uniref:DNA-binding transcriptional MerR regulator n=1 Tax=Sphaerisporangium rubeum TaxID=321317 RepID=A0A7X0M929_9ACTN|nr:MerR family transcriptional regulator [Sphaerisporangium rubeum]MBB6474619.1 DNA-binding transcriptional MerR regulator [Sphaerisporangium rubeum]
MSETWTIGELADRAAEALGPSTPRANGRVRDVPNERLIRWYTTIGLLDPPLTRRGRVALYGRRHLLQLVAVKRRQAEGLSIAAIQSELTGAPDSVLESLAHLPTPTPPGPPIPIPAPPPAGSPRTTPPLVDPPRIAPPPADPARTTRPPADPLRATPPVVFHPSRNDDARGPHPSPGAGPPPAIHVPQEPISPLEPLLPPAVRSPGHPGPSDEPHYTPDVARPRFWAERPATFAAAIPESPPGGHRVPPDLPPPGGDALIHGIRLARGVTLLIDGRTPGLDDITAIRTAAGTLLAVLQERHLLAPADPVEPHDLTRTSTTHHPSTRTGASHGTAIHDAAARTTTDPAPPHSTATHTTPLDLPHTTVTRPAADPVATHVTRADTTAGDPEGKQR